MRDLTRQVDKNQSGFPGQTCPFFLIFYYPSCHVLSFSLPNFRTLGEPWAVKIDKYKFVCLRADETKFEFNSGALATRESGSPANSLHFSCSPVRLAGIFSIMFAFAYHNGSFTLILI